MKTFPFPLLLLSIPCGLAAQDVPPDAGVLLIARNGIVVAQEEFAIRREGVGMAVSSTARWNGTARVLLAAYTPRRITVRVSSGAGEIAREFPVTRTVLLDDSSFVFLALVPREAGEVRVTHPRSGDRYTGTVTPRGDRVEITTGAGPVRIWFSTDGKFIRAEIPGRGLEVTRQSPP